MKASVLSLAVLAALVTAAPTTPVKRQDVGDTDNDLENGECGTAVLIYARGSTESGNMGNLGPQVCSGLQTIFGDSNIACQGVGDPYTADLQDNFLPGGTSQAAIAEAERLFNLAYTQCPDSDIVSGGYSQGSAVIAGAIPKLSSNVIAKIVGTVLYGYTQNQQNDGEIPDYPSQDLWVDCASGDPVCNGTLIVDAAHLSYIVDGDGEKGAQFLASKIQG